MFETIYDLMQSSLSVILPFLVILTILVFVHELGHYTVARFNKVKVEVFSIGFGKEIFGFNDKNGTRWKFSLIPLGGYVKMHGDADEASTKKKDETKINKNLSFHYKTVGQRSAILFAGPAANYLFSFILLIFINIYFGSPIVKPIISEIIPDKPASIAGLKKGDIITSIENESVVSFNDLRTKVEKFNNKKVTITISRDDSLIDYDLFIKDKAIGIKGNEKELFKLNFFDSVFNSFEQIYFFTSSTLKGILEIFQGKRGSEDLGGPIRIAELSSDFWKQGIHSTLWFMVIISLNLGLINLFPIPLLDGGHLLFNLIEYIKGSPISAKSMEVFQSFGFFALISLMLYATYNDISRFF